MTACPGLVLFLTTWPACWSKPCPIIGVGRPQRAREFSLGGASSSTAFRLPSAGSVLFGGETSASCKLRRARQGGTKQISLSVRHRGMILALPVDSVGNARRITFSSMKDGKSWMSHTISPPPITSPQCTATFPGLAERLRRRHSVPLPPGAGVSKLGLLCWAHPDSGLGYGHLPSS